ncbi:hypothetical protein SprV_0501813700 [Sparganum proliferum]
MESTNKRHHQRRQNEETGRSAKETTVSSLRGQREPKFINLSKRDPSSTEISLLSKGIRFSHTNAAPTDFLANLESLLLASDVPDDMCADIRSCAIGLLRRRKYHQTLPPEEEKALRSLKTDDKIVIMSVDKGGATVIMDKADYVNKAN